MPYKLPDKRIDDYQFTIPADASGCVQALEPIGEDHVKLGALEMPIPLNPPETKQAPKEEPKAAPKQS